MILLIYSKISSQWFFFLFLWAVNVTHKMVFTEAWMRLVKALNRETLLKTLSKGARKTLPTWGSWSAGAKQLSSCPGKLVCDLHRYWGDRSATGESNKHLFKDPGKWSGSLSQTEIQTLNFHHVILRKSLISDSGKFLLKNISNLLTNKIN